MSSFFEKSTNQVTLAPLRYFYLSMHFPAVTSSFLVFFLLFNKRLYDTLQEIWNFQPFLVNFFESIERRRGNPSELSCQPSFKLCSMRPGFLSLSLSLSLSLEIINDGCHLLLCAVLVKRGKTYMSFGESHFKTGRGTPGE